MSARSVLLATQARRTTTVVRSRTGSPSYLRVRKDWKSFLPLSGIRTTLRPIWHFAWLGLLFASLGSRRLAQFEAAPESVRRAFGARLREGLDKEREDEAWLEDAAPQRVFDTRGHRFVEWDESWQRRAEAIRKAKVHPEQDWTPNRDEDPLRDIPAAVYVEALTGEEVPRNGLMRCPLPDHDDFSPSFKVYDMGWRCFGCGHTGTVYDLASILWGIEARGSGFVELHKRLRVVFA